MKDKVKDFFKENGRMVILAIFIAEIILTIFITPNQYDDDFFIGKAAEGNIFGFVQDRYFNWTSRVLIEYVLCFVLKTSKYLWILLQALMVTLIGYSISEIFVKDDKNSNNVMLAFMIFLYPLKIMASAGWAATTINYIWPLATCLFAFIPLKKVWNGEKIKPYMYPLYSLALIFAGNQEQACAILAGTYILFTVFLIIRDKKIHPYIIVQDILIIASLVFILTCPGNYERTQTEISRHFKDIGTLNVLDKISLGLTSTISLIVAKGNIIYTMMTFLIVVYIFLNHKEKSYRVIALIPFISSIILKYLMYTSYVTFSYFGAFQEVLEKEQVMLTAANSNNLLYTLPLILAFTNFICVGLSLLVIFRNLKDNIAVLVFFIGLTSRLIMGFSPTIWISGERTMIFFEFAMIIVSILIWQELIKKTDKTDKKVQKRVRFCY